MRMYHKSKRQRKTRKKLFFVDILKVPDVKGQEPDLDPYQNVTEPQHWWDVHYVFIYCKMREVYMSTGV